MKGNNCPSPPVKRNVAGFCWLAISLGMALTSAQNLYSSPARQTYLEASRAFFSNAVVYQIKLEVTSDDMVKLRKNPRNFVQATVREGGEAYDKVGLHLKGQAGSFRGIDGPKPGFTLSFSKFEPKRKFHGTRKIHLNNAVQDASYLNENLAGELFRAAGVPAARVTYAMVELNDRKLGLYVLKEGISEDFLALYFHKTNGNLYDMEGGREVTEHMKRESGKGPDDWSDLKALASAAQEPDFNRRWKRLGEVLDLERFIAFMAMEMITCHWDGYCIGKNNFRVYHDMGTDKLVFIPHGMDQMFGDPNYAIRPVNFNGLVAQAVLKTPEGRRRYREQVGFLVTNTFRLKILTNRVNELAAQIRPALASYNTNAAREFDGQAEAVRSRLIQRAAGLQRLLNVPEPAPLKFDSCVAKLAGWRTADPQGTAKLEQIKDADGKRVLHIRATGSTFASWRNKVLLKAGHYRFEGLARAAGVLPIKDDKKGEGAGLRISRAQQLRPNKLSGDAPWQKLEYEFEVAPPNDEVDLICELRATQGEAWFDLDSLQLVRLK